MIIKHFFLTRFDPAIFLLIILFLFSKIGYSQEISVIGNSSLIADNDITPSTVDFTDFGAATSRMFYVGNSQQTGSTYLNISSIVLSDNTNFEITTNPSLPINGIPKFYYANFTIKLKGTSCGTFTSTVTISSNATNDGADNKWIFTIKAVSSPEINVLGAGNSIVDGDATPIITDNTDFGNAYIGTSIIKTFTIQNTGNCTLTSGAFSFSGTNAAEFALVTAPALSLASGATTTFQVRFTPAAAGIRTAAISFANNDANENPYNFSIQGTGVAVLTVGPGGVTTDLKLWLRADLLDGTTSVTDNTNVTTWKTQSGGSDATKPGTIRAPKYKNNLTDNINFNAVVDFTNNYYTAPQVYTDSNSDREYLKGTSGFYSQDLFVVLIPDVTVTASLPSMDIFTGDRQSSVVEQDATGIGYGAYTGRISNEVLTYASGTSLYYATAHVSTSASYNSVGILNARNNVSSNGMQLFFNGNNVVTSEVNVSTFANVSNSKYWIGRSEGWDGSLDGRIAEIITYSSRKEDAIERRKIESYLAIKYGITLGVNGTSQNYVNSSNLPIWNVTANIGYNNDIAGIGRDDASKLNQKQSKSVNANSIVTIGLGAIAATNTENTSTFTTDKSYLVWGHNNASLADAGSNFNKTIGTSVQVSSRMLNRKWKIVETTGDVAEVIVLIPTASLSGFTKTLNDEYVLIVSSTAAFLDADIIDVIPLKTAGSNLQTWYDFDETRFFTFGIAPKTESKYQSNIGTFDYFVGENNINLNSTFSISSWVKNSNTGTVRTFVAKGSDYELVLNIDNLIEVSWNGVSRIISNTPIADAKWHHIAVTYSGGTTLLYIDGILDKTETSLPIPTSSVERFSIGATYNSKNALNNAFLGDIDEVRIWDTALTEVQLHYLMNQEMEKFTDNNVNGKTIPQMITKNDVKTIPWTNVKAYYDLNTYYGTTSEDKSNNRNFLRVKYLKATKSVINTQTAPLPYSTKAGGTGNWEDVATWTNGSSQYLPNATVTRNGISNEITWNIVETAHNMTSGAKDITVLGLISKAGILTIANPTVTTPIENNSGQSLRVTHYLELDGAIDLVGESQLLQDTGSILDQDSGGYTERDQQGTANSYNYNYWSSSVGPISAAATKTTKGTGVASTNAGNYLGINGRTEGLMDGTSSGSPISINFQSAYWSADSGPSSPRTISTYWLYTFYGADDNYWAWKSVQATTPILAGEGYTMKGTSGAVAIATMQNYVFKGKPYNGDITLRLDKNITVANPAGDVDRLIGNPYPSALDANEFIKDHIKTTETINGTSGSNTESNIFNGALYFWDHFGAINSHNLGAYVGGYATYTLMGGTKAIADDARINTKSGLVSSKVPERYIPVGQGFFVITALDAKLAGKTTTTVDGGTITFKNSQRYFKREGSTSGIENTGSVFMKNADSKKENEGTNGEEVDLRPKIRLLFHSPNGYNRQLLIGANENTTNNFDIGYDGLIADTGSEDIFWMIQDAKFVIQGVPNFNTDQEFPLGIKIMKAGLANIKIEALENMDENLSVHIKDKLTGETHDISKKPFEIELAPGTYLDRFALTFKMQKLVAEDVVAEVLVPALAQPIIEGIHVFMNNAIGELQIKNNSTEEIVSVTLINALGQTVKYWNSNFNIRTISLPLSTATGIYFVQINTKTGKTVKKISVE